MDLVANQPIGTMSFLGTAAEIIILSWYSDDKCDFACFCATQREFTSGCSAASAAHVVIMSQTPALPNNDDWWTH